MPLANDGGRVAGLPEKFRKRLLAAIEEAIAVVVVPVEVGIFPGQHRCAARTAQRVGHEAGVKGLGQLGETFPPFNS